MDDSRQAISRADMSTLPGYTGARVSGCWALRTDGGGSGEDSLDKLLPPVSTSRRKSSTLGKTEPPLLRTGTRTIYTAGRPPWYNEHGALFKEAFVIGLCGGSASGKTTVANKIIEALDVPWVVLLSMDLFYKVLSPEEQAWAASNDYNFDRPGAFDFELVKIPVYDFTSHGRQRDWKNVYGASVIIFEGILSFADIELLQLMDMKIFVDTDSDIRLVRRLRRDITERGWDIEGVIKQYNKFVKPAFEQYIERTMRLADIVVPRGGGNMAAIDLIVQHVHSQLEEVSKRGIVGKCIHFYLSFISVFGHAFSWHRELSVRALLASAHQSQPLPQTLSVLESTPQVRGLLTIIRENIGQLSCEPNKDTSRDDTVQTPQGQAYEGRRFRGKGITGVSILRAGETMEPALRAVCKDVRIGKILIQTNMDSGEPVVIQCTQKNEDNHVILMDSTVSTGAAAMMVLLDHDVREDNIVLVSLLMAELGVHCVAYVFPRVKIVTTAVDKSLDDLLHVIPGIGDFGDRYFGTDGPSSWSDDKDKELQQELRFDTLFKVIHQSVYYIVVGEVSTLPYIDPVRHNNCCASIPMRHTVL
ncbi:putative uridine-cytidine kinase 1-like 1a [Triplophysa rosa]|uniref:uridine/cytidine kinase n=1 Tax=Triplophysa rosa TaxID=992332 RepID=A0A9W7TLM2_TRIRA|nr:putative uridine-cytidine kinase 1-like 1a [Triplophysa rosa]